MKPGTIFSKNFLFVLGVLTALSPAIPSLSKEREPIFICGKKYITLTATGGESLVKAGPVMIRKSDVRAVYPRYDEFVVWVDVGKVPLRPFITSDTFRRLIKCLR